MQITHYIWPYIFIQSFSSSMFPFFSIIQIWRLRQLLFRGPCSKKSSTIVLEPIVCLRRGFLSVSQRSIARMHGSSDSCTNFNPYETGIAYSCLSALAKQRYKPWNIDSFRLQEFYNQEFLSAKAFKQSAQLISSNRHNYSPINISSSKKTCSILIDIWYPSIQRKNISTNSQHLS